VEAVGAALRLTRRRSGRRGDDVEAFDVAPRRPRRSGRQGASVEAVGVVSRRTWRRSGSWRVCDGEMNCSQS
jgi:hypothetical protein